MQVGIDIGGTFTDCTAVTDEGAILSAKVPTTPENPSNGFFAALAEIGDQLELSTKEVLASTRHLVHGTTIATNALTQRRGARVGLITTRGHRDAIHMMRAMGRVAGLTPEEQIHAASTRKPEPLVPKSLIAEVSERLDYTGDVVVPFNEEEAIAARDHLLAEEVDSIAICFLWSFLNPANEHRMRDLVLDARPDLFVTCSSDLVPKAGEYERTAAAVVNGYVGPLTHSYIGTLQKRLEEDGYSGTLRVTQSTGGVLSAEDAAQSPLLLLESGPVAGVVGSQHLASEMKAENVIATDMGGTTFDVGLISEGQPVETSKMTMHQYEFYLQAVEVQSIGSGGGSIAWLQEPLGLLKVGPHSAGAKPGPVCYGLGGTEPTVTDSDVVLGYLNAEERLGGSISLDVEAARAALDPLAERLGMSTLKTAAGIVEIVDHQMANAIRSVTISRGYDPREFVLFAYGGAGPVHAGVYAAQLGVGQIIVPRGDLASVWSAFGCATADIVHLHEQHELMDAPFDVASVQQILDQLVATSARELDADDVPAGDRRFLGSADLRFRAQAHEITVPIPTEDLDEAKLAALVDDFEAAYQRRFGRGAGYREAGVELVSLRVRGVGRVPKPELTGLLKSSGDRKEPAAEASGPERAVYWPALSEQIATPTYAGPLLTPGDQIAGPAVLDFPDTSVVVHPEQTAAIDLFGNVVIELPDSQL